MMATRTSPLLILRLYRSLLKAAKPFDERSPRGTALSCLLHRTGLEDSIFHEEETISFDKRLFQSFLKEIITGGDSLPELRMKFPCHHRTISKKISIASIIRREFRTPSFKEDDSDTQPQDVAFLALRALNQKQTWANRLLNDTLPRRSAAQAARHVAPHASIQPGIFLLAHPHLTDYFRRSVICILDHNEDTFGTYGLIINRPCSTPHHRNSLTLRDVLPLLPSDLAAFASNPVREGGPVHMSLQMLHAAVDDNTATASIGGFIVPTLSGTDSGSSPAVHTDRAVYYKGDIIKAAQAVLNQQIEQQDVAFFAGASCWSPGQLESEIERGYWLTCRGPAEMALSGICEHETTSTTTTESRPKADLWLSMLSACGEDEAELAHLVWSDDGTDELGDACDEF